MAPLQLARRWFGRHNAIGELLLNLTMVGQHLEDVVAAAGGDFHPRSVDFLHHCVNMLSHTFPKGSNGGSDSGTRN